MRTEDWILLGLGLIVLSILFVNVDSSILFSRPKRPNKGWLGTYLDNGEYHVTPINDLVPHEQTEDCACSPKCEPIPRDDGSIGWMYSHNSMDQRERYE